MRKITYSIRSIYYIHATIEGLKGEFCTGLNTEDFSSKEIREVKRAARCIVNLCERTEGYIDFRENVLNSLVNGLDWTHVSR
jgi:hypothetical protein